MTFESLPAKFRRRVGLESTSVYILKGQNAPMLNTLGIMHIRDEVNLAAISCSPMSCSFDPRAKAARARPTDSSLPFDIEEPDSIFRSFWNEGAFIGVSGLSCTIESPLCCLAKGLSLL